MECYMCDAHSTGFCCGGCCGDAEDVIRQRQRQKLLQSVRKLKGLSRNSRSQVALDPVAVTESARAKLRLRRSLFCGNFGFGTCCVLLWLCLYGAALSTVHFQLLNLYKVLPQSAVWLLDSETIADFKKFLSFGILTMMVFMSAAFLAAAKRMCNLISSITAEVVEAAHEELRLDVCESIDHDFYAFVRRLQANFALSEDFNLAAIHKAHRRLHSLLKARISLNDFDFNGPFAIRREVQGRISAPKCCMMFLLFIFPWVLMIGFNLTQILVVNYYTGIEIPPTPAEPSKELMQQKDLETVLNDSWFFNIATSLLINFTAAIYLAAVQSRCVEKCFLGCLYPRIHGAVIDFCNRLISRTWEESVVEELVEFVEEPGAASDKRTADREISPEMYQPAGGDLPAISGSFGSGHDKRLLTSESRSPYPTSHQLALQAPASVPRSTSHSQSLNLEPFTMSPVPESCSRTLSGCEGLYLELEDVGLPPFDGSKIWSDSEHAAHMPANSNRGARSAGTSEQPDLLQSEGSTQRNTIEAVFTLEDIAVFVHEQAPANTADSDKEAEAPPAQCSTSNEI